MLRVVLSSCPPDAADTLASALVAERVAACVSVLPGAVSTYRWQGEVQRDTEHLLLIKVPSQGLPRLMARLAELHPYDTPEIVALPADHVSPGYAAWASDQIS